MSARLAAVCFIQNMLYPPNPSTQVQINNTKIYKNIVHCHILKFVPHMVFQRPISLHGTRSRLPERVDLDFGRTGSLLRPL